jgi:filamentous hemagglutinin family protein
MILITTNSNLQNDYAMDETSGKMVGNNLFYSFLQFSLATGESATFNLTENIQNILARVSGGSPSTIDGTINVNSPVATNFFLMNPAGVIFTSNADLNVPGSFTVTTADYLKFADGKLFNALPGPSDTSLSAAEVSAFGFLPGKSAPPSPVTFSGSDLSTMQGMDLVVVGGNVTIDGASLSAPVAHLTLVSVAGPGEVPADPSVLAMTPLAALPALGIINIQNFAEVSVGSFGIAAAGHVEIDAGVVNVLNGSIIDASMFEIPDGSAGLGGSTIFIRCQTLLVSDGSAIQAQGSGFGVGGAINIQAQNVTLTDAGAEQSFIETTSSDQTIGGDITLAASTLSIQGSGIETSSNGSGGAGNINVTANNLSIIGKSNPLASGILAESGFSGPAGESATGRGGDVSLVTQHLTLTDGGQISATTFGPGEGGNVSVSASDITISGFSTYNAVTSIIVFQSGILANSALTGDQGLGGHGGNVSISTNSLNISNSGLISTSTLGSGDGGNVMISAGSILLDGTGATLPTGIAASTSYQTGGKGGDITIAAGSLQVLGGAAISAATAGGGAGGNISIAGGTALVSGPNSIISAQTTAPKGGAGGNLQFNVNSISVLEAGRISASTLGSGQGGSIEITANQVAVDGGASISADTSGVNGIVTLDPPVQYLRLTLTVENASDSNLRASLVNPADNDVVLFNKGDATGINLSDTIFIDSGATQITAGVAPYSGIFQPAASLSLLNGGPANGTWQLAIGNSGLGSGILESWSLMVNGKQFSSSDVPQTIGARSVLSASVTVALPTIQTLEQAGAGGSIQINAGTVLVRNGGTVSASTSGDGAAGSLNIQANSVTVDATGAASDTGFFASAAPGSTGPGGSISIAATEFQVIGNPNPTISGGVVARSATNARAGDIMVQSADLTLDANAVISSANTGGGPAGSVNLTASNSIMLQGGSLVTVVAQSANAGTISLTAGQNVELQGGSTVTASAGASGGSIMISAGGLFGLDHSSVVATAGAGSGGNITVDSASANLEDGLISGNSAAGANAGNIALTIGQNVELQEGSTITASAAAGGGSITISAGGLFDLDRSSVVATAGSGAGGDITIDPTSITLERGLISANSAAGANAGIITLTADQNIELQDRSAITAAAGAIGGNITLTAGQNIELQEGSTITTSAGANAGNVSLIAGQNVELHDGSTIAASAGSGGGSILITAGGLFYLDHSSLVATTESGTGGNITIDPTFIILDHGLISANAAAGAGGNILIKGDYFFDNETPITATGSTAGTVQITTLPLDIVNALADLQGGFIDISTALLDRCAMRLGTDFSSFLVIGRGGVEDSPDEPQKEAASGHRQKGKGKRRGR